MYSSQKGTGFSKLSYNYRTVLEEYSDNTWANFLVSELVLADLETYALEDKDSNIRLTLGWKNNQEDAYDFSGINIAYNKDPKRIKFTCVDGYGFGTTSTYVTNPKTGLTVGGEYNQTIK